MEIGLTAILAELTLVYLLSRIIIYIELKYLRNHGNDYIAVNIYVAKSILLYSMKVPVVEIVKHNELLWLETEIETRSGRDKTHIEREQRFAKNTFLIYLFNPRKLRRLFKLLRHYVKVYRRFARKIVSSLTCEHFYWKTRFGSDDAAMTGILTGGIWAAKGTLVTILKRRFEFISEPVITVIPVFGQECLEVDFQCIFSLQLGKVIRATTILFNLQSKEANINGRTSNSRSNEDCYGKHKRYG